MSPIERSAGGSGGSGFANPMTTAGDIIIENAVPAPARLGIGSAGQTLGVSGGLPAWGFGGIGGTTLIYRYTVTGADKTSIDTGVDTADAGSNDWTNGDLLEFFIVVRTDDAAAVANVTVVVNNDTTAGHYDDQFINVTNATVSGAPETPAAGWLIPMHGTGGTASYPAALSAAFPDFSGTTFFKVGTYFRYLPDGTAANSRFTTAGLGWRSTAAMTRLAVAAGAGQKLKVGSQVLIYKRLAS